MRDGKDPRRRPTCDWRLRKRRRCGRRRRPRHGLAALWRPLSLLRYVLPPPHVASSIAFSMGRSMKASRCTSSMGPFASSLEAIASIISSVFLPIFPVSVVADVAVIVAATTTIDAASAWSLLLSTMSANRDATSPSVTSSSPIIESSPYSSSSSSSSLRALGPNDAMGGGSRRPVSTKGRRHSGAGSTMLD